MLKVLHVIGGIGYGGAELVVLNLSRRLQKYSIGASILAIGHCDEKLSNRFREQGVEIASPGDLQPGPLAIKRVIDHVNQIDVDVVHVHLFPQLYYCALATKFVRKRILWIYTEHSTSNRRRNIFGLRPIEKLVYGQFDNLTAISRAAAKNLSEWLSIDIEDICVIPNGINCEALMQPAEWDKSRFGLAESDKIIAMTGAFRSEKNHQVLVRALSHLPKRFHVMFAGTGSTKDAVESLAIKLSVKERVHFLGNVEDIGGLLKMADFYVQPSEFEGFGIGALEAAAVGTPIIYSDVPGLADIFDGCGWPISHKNPLNIADTVLHVECNEEGRNVLRTEAFRKSAEFDFEKTVSAYEAVYRSLKNAFKV